MSPQEARALAMAHELHQLLNELQFLPEHGAGSAVAWGADYVADVVGLLEDRTAIPVRPPSPPCPPKQGDAVAILRCEQALAQMRRTKAFLEAHFETTEDEPGGWCPLESISYLEDAINMLEPLPAEESDDEPDAPGLRLVLGSKT
jgi:hypothetical protein